MRVLLADDEPHARSRLRVLLADLAGNLPTRVVAETANGEEAVQAALAGEVDVALLDIHMPGMDGLTAARHLLRLPKAPAVIFLTAHDQHAVAAFELGALDYLLKPVRGERLLVALQRARRLVARDDGLLLAQGARRSHLLARDRGRVSLVPVGEILFLRAEEKYVVAQTREKAFLLDEALQRLEEELGTQFLRIHRACLVNRRSLRGFELAPASGQWMAVLRDWPERLPVSRRQAHVVKLFREGMGSG